MNHTDIFPESSWTTRAREHLGARFSRAQIVAGLFIALIALGTVGYFLLRAFPRHGIKPRAYGAAFSLVPEKLSQSAAIALSLPKGVRIAHAEAAERVTFEPTIAGAWLEPSAVGAARDERLIFQPKEPLKLGTYYAVSVNTGAETLRQDFLVDEDPAIVAMFPAAGSEAPETSSITIIFNRPMVPLTTLETLDAVNIPVEIAPATAGKFKWITTRNLQFIPETRLMRSANFTVRVKPGLVSMDGLPVRGTEQQFTTRHLRYEHIDGGVHGFAEPVRIRFNQPVDIEKTRTRISVTKIEKTGMLVAGLPKRAPAVVPGNILQAPLPFILAYGTRNVYNAETEKSETFLDMSVLEVYNAQDRFGREGFWDFDTSYSVTVGGAYPIDGDLALAETRQSGISIPEVITSLSAESNRSALVEPDLFDPQGTITVEFAERIDKDASTIKAKGLLRSEYGEMCAEDEVGRIYYGDECKKVPDTRHLVLHFDPQAFGRGESISIRFEKIFNVEGLLLNAAPIERTITTYPNLIVYKTTPQNGATRAALTELVVCTSNPLTPATEENFTERLESNFTVGLWNWQAPWRVSASQAKAPCAVGQFVNTIRYGLVPEYPYRFTLNLVDDFGQASRAALSFTSGSIERTARKFFHQNKRYNATSPTKTKFTYAVENLEYVDLSICEVTAQTMLRYNESPPEARAAPATLPCIASETHRVELPRQYWTRNFFQIDLKQYIPDARARDRARLGHFVLTFSHPEYRRLEWIYDSAKQKYTDTPQEQIFERTLLTVTNLAVAEKKVNRLTSRYETDPHKDLTDAALDGDQNLYWVSTFGTLAPEAGATVALYTLEDSVLREVAQVKTGSNGVARTAAVMNLFGAAVSAGDDSAIVSEQTDRLAWASSAVSSERAYIYTDRPIYRPGQEVFIKGIYREGYDRNYTIPTSKKSALIVRNSRAETILETEVELNEFGTFTALMRLPADAVLGTYSLQAFGGGAVFDVEEYAAAAFKLDLRTDKEEYIAGETMRLAVDADYYFGVPLEEGSAVSYTVTSQSYFFDRYERRDFDFGSGWYYSSEGDYGDRFVLRGSAVMNKNGEALIEKQLDFNELFKEEARKQSKIFVVNVTVKNRNGQSISAQKSFIVHRGEFYLDVRAEPRFVGLRDAVTLRVKSVDINGKDRNVRSGVIAVKRVSWESFRRREVDGGYYYRSEKKEEVVREIEFRTGRDGLFEEAVTLDREGQYEIVATALDQRTNPVEALESVYASGPRAASVRPTNNETLDLAVETDTLDVGARGRFTIESPYPRAKALVALERGKIFTYEVVDVDRNFLEYTFPVKDEYVPNVYATVLLLSPDPAIKYGQVNFKVNTTERELDIEVTPDKRAYLPGEEVGLSIVARDRHGRPVAAEISVAVADLSVLALKGNPKKNPVAFFYAGSPLAVVTSSNVKNILEEKEVPSGTKGGGGGDPKDLARRKRGVFKDTALWEGVVRTDASGRAHIRFTLPDNLTTWQVEGLATTRESSFGVDYEEFTARKELMVVPLRPRFIVPGDAFTIGAQVFNQTTADQALDVTLASPTLEFLGKRELSTHIRRGESATFYFPVRAPQGTQEGKHTFTLSAHNRQYEDTVEQSIPITRNDTYEAVATAHFTRDESAREYVYVPENIEHDRGGVSISVSGTLAVFLSDALNYLASYPYGCSEQIASTLSSIAILKRGLDLENVGDAFSLKPIVFDGREYTIDEVVEIGLARLYANQTASGGFSYYATMQPNFHLTLHMVNTLIELEAAGYTINHDALTRAAHYLYTTLTQTPHLSQSKDTVILTAYAILRVPGAILSREKNDLTARIQKITEDTAYVREQINNTSLTHLAMILSRLYPSSLSIANSKKKEIYTTLENRIDIDARGAFLGIHQGRRMWEYYETPTKDTALLLKALVADRRESPVMDKVLRWLLKSRAKDGAWGSTNNTAAVVDAMTDFLSWKRETESDFELTLSRGTEAVQTFDFGPETILKTFSAFLPVAAFTPGTIETLNFEKKNRTATAPNTFYYDMSLKYYLPIDTIPPRDEGFTIEREFYRLDDKKLEKPVAEAAVGDVLRGRLTVTVSKPRNFVAVEDFIPAGAELVNLKLATEDQSLADETPGAREHGRGYDYYGEGGYYDEGEYYDGGGDYDGGRGALDHPFSTPGEKNSPRGGPFAFFKDLVRSLSPQLFVASVPNRRSLKALADEAYSEKTARHRTLRPDAEELHDDRVFLFTEALTPGVYIYDYFVRALIPGTYHHLPAVASELYYPENFGRTRGEYFRIIE